MRTFFKVLIVLAVCFTITKNVYAEAVQWEENGHWYDWYTDFLSWEEAKAKAEYMGGHLATVTSQSENDWLTNNFSLTTGNQTNNYIGGYQYTNSSEPDGGWKWVTNEPWDYTNWGTPYQPDNWKGPGGYEDYLTLYPTTAGGKWNDYAEKAPYLVEWDKNPEFGYSNYFFSDFSGENKDFRDKFIDRPVQDNWGDSGHSSEFINEDGANVVSLKASVTADGNESTSRIETKPALGTFGTYSARVKFSDIENENIRDVNDQDFYAINRIYNDHKYTDPSHTNEETRAIVDPSRANLYSEVDFEYLTRADWDGTPTDGFLQTNSWSHKDFPYDDLDISNKQNPEKLTGIRDDKWYTLTFQVQNDGGVKYFVDDELIRFMNDDDYKVDHGMHVEFSNWFHAIDDVKEDREYSMYVDWFLYSPDLIDFNEINSIVDGERGGLKIQAFSPVDLEIVDPSGHKFSKSLRELEAFYNENEFLDSGDFYDTIFIPSPLAGQYEINVLPNPNASPDELVSLLISNNDYQHYIFRDRKISELSKDAYLYTLDDTIQTNAVPEPSTLILLGMGMPILFRLRKRES